MQQVTAVLVTGPVPNFLRKAFQPTDCTRRIKSVRGQGMITATNISLRVDGIFSLHFQIVDLRFTALFGILDRLAVALRVDTSVIDRYIKGLLPQDLKVVPSHSIPVEALDEAATKSTAMIFADY